MTTLHSSLLGTELHQPFASGLYANIPATPVVGDWYYATNTYKMYYCKVAGAWLEAPLGTIFYDRGDPAAYDLDQSGMTMNNTWVEWDLSSIVPTQTTAVLLVCTLAHSSANMRVSFRKHGNSNTINTSAFKTSVANYIYYSNVIVACSADYKIEYNVSATMDTIAICVAGWFK